MGNQSWFFARAGQRSEAVTLDELRTFFKAGKIAQSDLVWTEGFATWVPAEHVAELRAEPAPSADVVAQSSPHSQIEYYTRTGMPERAAKTFARHAQPRGDIGHWPVDDADAAAFELAGRTRKRITAAARLYVILLSLFDAFALLVLGVGIKEMGDAPNALVNVIGLVVIAVFMIGATALMLWAAAVTRRSKRWAPLTMFILAGIAEMICFIMSFGVSDKGSNAQWVGQIILMAVLALTAWISWRAYAAIPTYLAQPAWCQELFARARL